MSEVLRLGGEPLPVIGPARMYVCGITPYDATHVGHAATFVWSDVAARVLQATGLEVEVCRNITDVDDDLLEQARVREVPWRSLATQQTYRFERDMDELHVARPTHEPRSHDYVDEVIALSAALLDRAAAYERKGTVYFRGDGVADRAGISHEEAIDLAAERGGRPDDPDKDDPLDAAVWQRSADGEPSWPSPWGPGRPGWHAECSAMGLATLGPGIDVHAGGSDLVFPHHAYEAAQAEAATGVAPYARRWLRVGAVMVAGEKMAKSKGNLVLVHDLLERWSPDALRLLILSHRWDAPWEFREADLKAASAAVDELWVRAGKANEDAPARSAVMDALLDDLDVQRALELARESGGRVARWLLNVLGLVGP